MNEPRHDIRSHVDAIITIASQLDPNGVDSAIADIPGAWDIVSISTERHGYNYLTILACGSAGYNKIMGEGHSIGKSIRNASEKVRLQYPLK